MNKIIYISFLILLHLSLSSCFSLRHIQFDSNSDDQFDDLPLKKTQLNSHFNETQSDRIILTPAEPKIGKLKIVHRRARRARYITAAKNQPVNPNDYFAIYEYLPVASQDLEHHNKSISSRFEHQNESFSALNTNSAGNMAQKIDFFSIHKDMLSTGLSDDSFAQGKQQDLKKVTDHTTTIGPDSFVGQNIWDTEDDHVRSPLPTMQVLNANDLGVANLISLTSNKVDIVSGAGQDGSEVDIPKSDFEEEDDD